jgi:hypothetical protein
MHDHFNAWDVPDIAVPPDRKAPQARTINDELPPGPGLPPAVSTGVTVSVLAAFLGVIRGLFPGKDERAPAPP